MDYKIISTLLPECGRHIFQIIADDPHLLQPPTESECHIRQALLESHKILSAPGVRIQQKSPTTAQSLPTSIGKRGGKRDKRTSSTE